MEVVPRKEKGTKGTKKQRGVQRLLRIMYNIVERSDMQHMVTYL